MEKLKDLVKELKFQYGWAIISQLADIDKASFEELVKEVTLLGYVAVNGNKKYMYRPTAISTDLEIVALIASSGIINTSLFNLVSYNLGTANFYSNFTVNFTEKKYA